MIAEKILPIIIILFVGLPHGAADILIAKRLFRDSYFHILFFILAYSLIALIVGIIWLIIPTISLLLFLLISIGHFGLMDTYKTRSLPFRYVRAGLYGFTPIIIPLVFHTNEVNLLFSLLLFSNNFEIINYILFLFPLWIIGNLVFLYKGGIETKFELLEIFLISIVLIILPPLWGFAFYFCIIHSSRHSINVFFTLEILSKTDWLSLILIILATLLFIFLGAYLFSTNNFDNSLIRLTFISLAALTIPHIILIDFYKGLTLISKKIS
ncbi:MAG: hypothetical protein CBC47_06625 [Alphaproteobacteria bacterium TMED87]|nr:hypothetical protein [Rhodospirillaceae bacterium]OUV08907.1 MAG: hypothetical protein CBC47_06625 [Alphaproteobacteria bacterium TMED87]